jgi:Lon protease-like protein
MSVAGPAWAQATKLPAEIPIFPLPNVVLFPNATRPLLIFEPRYRTMIAEALEGDRIIGMVLLRPGYEQDYEGRPPIFEIGCAGEIAAFELLEDGRYTIRLRGLTRFRITSEDQRRPYRMGRVEPIAEAPTDEAALRAARVRLVEALSASLAPGSAGPPGPELGDEEFVHTIAQYLRMPEELRQDLLERNGALARARGLIDLLQPR